MFHQSDTTIAKCTFINESATLNHRTELLTKRAITTIPNYKGVRSHVDESSTYYIDELLQATPLAPLSYLDSSASPELIDSLLGSLVDYFEFMVTSGLKIPGTIKEATKLLCNNMAFITDYDTLIFLQVFKLEPCKKPGDQLLLIPNIFKHILMRDRDKKQPSISCDGQCRIKSQCYYTLKYAESKFHTFCLYELTPATILNALDTLLPNKKLTLRAIQNVAGLIDHSFITRSTARGTESRLGLFSINGN